MKKIRMRKIRSPGEERRAGKARKPRKPGTSQKSGSSKKPEEAGRMVESAGIDYQRWDFTTKEYLEMTVVSICITAGINLLCYRSIWAMFLFLPVEIFYIRSCRKRKVRKRQEQLYDHFRDLIAWMHTALRSGYSMENAVLEAAGQMEQSLGKEDVLVQELRYMRHKMMLSVPVEQLFQDLAMRSHIDDIDAFASVLIIAKRTGGNICEVFQNTWDIFCTRIDTMREIRSSVSSRQFEQNIMSIVPFGILVYVQFSFPEFLEVLYGNVTGVLFMSGCLVIYLTAFLLGKKILEVEF